MPNNESVVEKYLHDGVVKLGGDTFKWQGVGGEPDRVVCLPNGMVWFVEVKTLHGKLQANQQRFHNRLKAKGQNVTTIYGKNGVNHFIEGLKNA